ncbi:MAG: type II secretion system protein [Fibrobacter sp.]|nr:type II secretion system protein [Fibrobacter sp.]
MLLDKAFKRRKGFGIIEVLVSITVLGFLYLALMNLQLGNRQSLLRIRGRDAAVEVAQQVLDSLQSIGAASIVSDSVSDITFKGLDYRRKWARSNIPGDSMSVVYSTELTVKPDSMYHSKDTTKFATVEHVYAKNVSVKVSWPFKGSIQSISISGVIR